MSTPVFQWFPDASLRKSVESDAQAVRFGDGYEQRFRFGIAPLPEQWEMAFTGTRGEIDPIDAFLSARKGVESFQWTTPDGVTGLFVCRSWQKSRERGVKVSLSATFERVQK